MDKWKSELYLYQKNIALSWKEKSRKARNIFSKFFFYYSAIDALYFLWGKLDGIQGDEKRMQNLIKEVRR